jgi:hypothetical protein
MFTRHTTISHNEIFDLPYDAITSGAWQGHVDVPEGSEPVNVYYNTTSNIISDAGLTSRYRGLENSVTPSVYYTGVSGSSELIAGEGLASRTVVSIGGVRVHLRFLSAGFALASIPPGADGTAVTLGASNPTSLCGKFAFHYDGGQLRRHWRSRRPTSGR